MIGDQKTDMEFAKKAKRLREFINSKIAFNFEKLLG